MTPPQQLIDVGPDPVVDADELPRRRRLRRPEPAPLVLNIVSMIDVIFLLMTYFLLTAKFATREESFPVSVPTSLEGSAAPAPADDFALPQTPIVLTVRTSPTGPIILADTPVLRPASGAAGSFEELVTIAAAARGAMLPADQRFTIVPEAGTRWEHALGVLNALKRAGFDNVRFGSPSRPR